MKLSFLVVFICFSIISCSLGGKEIGHSVPKSIKRSDKYLFYLHGGVVTSKGNNGVNPSMPEWGSYEYLNILDSLQSRGFNIISENRKPGIEDSVYAIKIAKQIDTLLHKGVRPGNIVIVGASAGAFIALDLAARIKEKNMQYVIMGACLPETHKAYKNIILYGHFLSIIESSDPHGSCFGIFDGKKELSSYKEIVLNLGISHAFIYKGYKDWIDPIITWVKEPK